MSTEVWGILVGVVMGALIVCVAAGSIAGMGVALVALVVLLGVRLPGDGLTGGRARRCSRRRGE